MTAIGELIKLRDGLEIKRSNAKSNEEVEFINSLLQVLNTTFNYHKDELITEKTVETILKLFANKDYDRINKILESAYNTFKKKQEEAMKRAKEKKGEEAMHAGMRGMFGEQEAKSGEDDLEAIKKKIQEAISQQIKEKVGDSPVGEGGEGHGKKFCGKCGNKLKGNEEFCGKCGEKL